MAMCPTGVDDEYFRGHENAGDEIERRRKPFEGTGGQRRYDGLVDRRTDASKLVHMNGNATRRTTAASSPYQLYRPGLKIGTVEVIRQRKIPTRLDPEALGKADFFICVPKDMTSTF